jgi:hypothetical protein
MKKAIVIDSCLLVLLVVGLTNRKYVSRHKNLYPVYNAGHFDALLAIVKEAPKIICTAHILTETSNLLRQVSDPIRSEIMTAFRQVILSAGELHIESRKASEAPIFIRLGLTDAAIISLDPKEVQILTVDHELHIASSQGGFDVVNLTPLFHEPRK